MKPVVLIGHKGITDALCQSIDDALEKHELIKMKFVDFKEKDQKKALAATIEEKTNCELVGLIGHTGIFYRQQNDPEKRKITVPAPKG
jgi:RNA-binding protein